MSIRAGTRPKWLYWPKDGYGQFHVTWLWIEFRLVYRDEYRLDYRIEREYWLEHDRAS
jgi:hypothetical protein